MLVPKDLIIEAKNKFGDKSINLIKEYFNLENWLDKNSSGSCPFGHKDETPSFIYNFKNNSFHCFSCGRNFGILDLYQKMGLTFLESVEKLFDETGTQYKFGERGLKTRKKDYKYPVVKCIEDQSKVDNYFATRKISKETLDYCHVGQDEKSNIVWKFYDENDVLLTIKMRPARKILKTEKIEKEWYLPNYSYTPILFNMNHCDYTNGPLIICEGQTDCLSIIESGYFNVVSVPGGTSNLKWVEECYEWLEKFEQIIIFSDSDESGLNMRKEVVARLGQWRTKFIEIPPEYKKDKLEIKDANDILVNFGPQILLDLISNAQEVPITGIINLAEVDDFEIEKAPGIVTGFQKLDDIIYKFLFGNVMVITGQRSAGKSSFINQVIISETLNQGYDAFVFSGELSSPVFKSWLNVTLAGPEAVTLKNKFVHVIDISAKKKIEKWYNNRVFFYDNDKDRTVENILDKAIACTRRFGCKVWVLDNLSVMDIGDSGSDEYRKQKEFIAKLIGLANLYNVLIVLVIHARKLQNGVEIGNDDVAGSAALTNLPQYVVSAKRYADSEKKGELDGKGKYKKGKEPIDEDACVNVLKNRYIGRSGVVKFYFDYKSRRFYTTSTDLNKRYGWNDDTSPLCKYDPKSENKPDFMKEN